MMTLATVGGTGCLYAELGAGYAAGTAEGVGAYNGPMFTATAGFGTAYSGGSVSVHGVLSRSFDTPRGILGMYVYHGQSPWTLGGNDSAGKQGWTLAGSIGGAWLEGASAGEQRWAFGLHLFAGLSWYLVNSRGAGVVLSLGPSVMGSTFPGVALGGEFRLRISNGELAMGAFSFGRGRPLWFEGAPVLADRSEGGAWQALVADTPDALDEVTKRALASAWLHDALEEHVSIAAFTRVSMQLLAVGAPPALLDGAHLAARDEIEHARLCFGLAARYGATEASAGPLRVEALREAVCDHATLARESLVEGCLGEGVAATVARESLALTTDPEALRALEVIADDEARHAELAWELLAWCLEVGGPRVVVAVAEALETLGATLGPVPVPQGADERAWEAHGRALPELTGAIQQAVIRAVRARAWALPAMAARLRPVEARVTRERRRAESARTV